MKNNLIGLIVTAIMPVLSAGAIDKSDIAGVWEQNPYLHGYEGRQHAIVHWQLTDDGKFRYEESDCGNVYNALAGSYTLSGSTISFTVEEVIYHHYHTAESFAVGMTASVGVSADGGNLQFSSNPFVEVATLTLDRVSEWPAFSPDEILKGTWAMGYGNCSGELDPDENSATRLNPDHTLNYIWGSGSPVLAKGTWSVSNGVLSYGYDEVQNPEYWCKPGMSMDYPILICSPERVILLQNDHHEGNDRPVFTPTSEDLIAKYFGGVETVKADSSPNLVILRDGVRVENAGHVILEVFAMDGKSLRRYPAYNGEKIPLDAGQYIIKAGDQTFKVLL